MANEKTTNYEWDIEEEYADPFYPQAKVIRNQIDATVYGIDQRVVDVEADSLNAEYLWNQPIDEIFDGDTDGVQVADTAANLLTDPNNIPNWANARCVNGATDEIIADTADNTHFRSKDATYAAGKYVIGADFKTGNKPWVSFLVTDSSNSSIVFNTSTLEVGSTSGTFEYRFVDPIDATFDCRVELCIDKTAGFYGVAFFAYESDTDATFAGDGATVNTYVKNIHAYKGEFGDNVKFADGGASAVPPTTTVSKLIYKQAKWDAGLVEDADGDWIPVSSVDGDLMDGSAGNEAVLRDAGKWKRIDGAWYSPVYGDDEEYYCNTQEPGHVTYSRFIDDPLDSTTGVLFTTTDANPGLAPIRESSYWKRPSNGDNYLNTSGSSVLTIQIYGDNGSNNMAYYQSGLTSYYGRIDFIKDAP